MKEFLKCICEKPIEVLPNLWYRLITGGIMNALLQFFIKSHHYNSFTHSVV